MSFAGARLTISENGGVFSVHEVIDMAGDYFVEEELLGDELSENPVKTVAILPIVNHRSVVLVVV